MKILITNDDGINDDGIVRLAQVAKQFGEVTVVAPLNQCSAMSRCLTLNRSILVQKTCFPVKDVDAWSVDGTPVDCVKIAILNIIKEKPDIVLSGINNGINAGIDIQYSGTAGAAFDATIFDVPAIAVSEFSREFHELTDHYLAQILCDLFTKKLPYGQIWNVNFPPCTIDQCNGIQYDRTPAKKQLYKDRYCIEKQTPDCLSLHINGVYTTDAEPNSDIRAILENYISIGIVKNLS